MNRLGLLYILHGFLLWFAWGILGFLQIASSRYLKSYWKFTMWIHRISGSLVILITFVMSLLVFNAA